MLDTPVFVKTPHVPQDVLQNNVSHGKEPSPHPEC